MDDAVTLTRRELDIMSVLWRRGTATVAEVRDDLADDLAYPTVQSMLRVLEGKGYVGHTVEGRAFLFHALVEQGEAADSALARLVSKVYHGSRELLVNRLLADEDIPPDELRRIKAMLQKRLDERSK
ncbi:MAG: BlaI/MecI/CopY family transcriptional regulator [Gemmatimonadota bacterium]